VIKRQVQIKQIQRQKSTFQPMAMAIVAVSVRKINNFLYRVRWGGINYEGCRMELEVARIKNSGCCRINIQGLLATSKRKGYDGQRGEYEKIPEKHLHVVWQ